MTAIETHSAQETEDAAARLARRLRPGDLLCLRGDLGAGKTTFVRGLARGLGSPAAVSSPTFTLIHEYEGGRAPLCHADAYRLSGPDEVAQTGLDDYLRGGWIVALEWPERLEGTLPAARWEVALCGEGESRRIVVTPPGDAGRC